jgi:hypothetical protein
MRFLLILLFIYFLYQVFFNLILPLVARHFVQKTARSMQGAYREPQRNTSARREGDIRIETPGKGTDEGEYVDFTEVR